MGIITATITKIKTKTIALAASTALIVLAPLMSIQTVFAASGTLTLSPASGSISQGSIITVYVYENSGADAVDAAQVNLSYPANLLDYVSVTSSSAFSTVASTSGGGGGVSIARAAIPAVAGSQLVASVRFKAKTSSGSASITFAGGSTLVSGGNGIPTSTRGATFNLTPVPVAPPPPPKDTTPPTITNVKVTAITNNTATVTWTTSEPANSAVDYGPNTSYGLSGSDASNVTEHKVVLNSALLSPGISYHYVVKSADPAGNVTSGKDATFKTKGLNMTVNVNDQKKQPVSGAKVSFQSKTATTDSKGKAVLKDLQLGKGNLVIAQGNDQTSKNIEVVQSGADLAKPVNVLVVVKSKSSVVPLAIGIGAVLLVAGSALLLRRRSGPRAPSAPTGSVDSDMQATLIPPPAMSSTPTLPPASDDGSPVVIAPDEPDKI